jgi:hypothetical protein
MDERCDASAAKEKERKQARRQMRLIQSALDWICFFGFSALPVAFLL